MLSSNLFMFTNPGLFTSLKLSSSLFLFSNLSLFSSLILFSSRTMSSSLFPSSSLMLFSSRMMSSSLFLFTHLGLFSSLTLFSPWGFLTMHRPDKIRRPQSLRRGSRRVLLQGGPRALAPWIPRVAGARASSGSQSC